MRLFPPVQLKPSRTHQIVKKLPVYRCAIDRRGDGLIDNRGATYDPIARGELRRRSMGGMRNCLMSDASKIN
jgi:hypothetical protein